MVQTRHGSRRTKVKTSNESRRNESKRRGEKLHCHVTIPALSCHSVALITGNACQGVQHTCRMVFRFFNYYFFYVVAIFDLVRDVEAIHGLW